MIVSVEISFSIEGKTTNYKKGANILYIVQTWWKCFKVREKILNSVCQPYKSIAWEKKNQCYKDQ